MTRPFYDEGCTASGPLRWPVVALRRLLRRIQRPFFFALQAALDRLSETTTAHRAQLDAHRAEMDRQWADLHLQMAQLVKMRHELGVEINAIRTEMGTGLDRLRTELKEMRLDAEDQLNLLRQRVRQAVENEGIHPLGLVTLVESLDRANRPPAAPWEGPPPRVLVVVSSASQLYSGIGRALFETVRRLIGRVEYEFTIDDAESRNVTLLSDFCREHGLRLQVGPKVKLADCVDWGNERIPELLRGGGWDAIECVSWASSATNAAVLEHAGDVPIIYTPHYQPLWTVPAPADVHRRITAVHGELLRRAALVACDSPWEWLLLRAETGPGVDCVLLPLGIDASEFVPGPVERRPQLLFVGDQREGRKRFGLTLEVFAELIQKAPEYRLVVVGNKSTDIGGAVPEAVRARCELKGYVSEEALRGLYRESMGLILLSDYEAFGLPLAESLASGTPVFVSRRGAVSGVFGRYRGAVLIDDDKPALMAEAILAALSRGPELIRDALADRPRVAADLSWDLLTEQRYEAMTRALARRHPVRAAA